MTDFDNEILKIYNRIQQVSVIIENVFQLINKSVDVFVKRGNFISTTQLKTNEIISRRITLLEELATILTKLHEAEIGQPKIEELLLKTLIDQIRDEKYNSEWEKIRKNGEFETQEVKLLGEEIESLKVEIENFMVALAKKIDKQKLKLERKDEKE